MPRKRTARSAPVKQRILIVDNQPLMRRGLKAVINAEHDLIVCGEAANAVEGLAAIPESRPDLVIIDLSPSTGDGLELVRATRSRHAGLPVLVLTSQDMPGAVELATAAGANGHVSKQEVTGALLTAIRSVLRRER